MGLIEFGAWKRCSVENKQVSFKKQTKQKKIKNLNFNFGHLTIKLKEKSQKLSVVYVVDKWMFVLFTIRDIVYAAS